MTDMKPCPFCGKRPTLTLRPDNSEATAYFAAVGCFCGGYSTCAHKMATAPEADEAEALAVAAWNARAALAAPAAQEQQAEPRLRMALRADLATESLAVDSLLQAMGEDPERFRTEGGVINSGRLLAWLKERASQAVPSVPADHFLDAGKMVPSGPQAPEPTTAPVVPAALAKAMQRECTDPRACAHHRCCMGKCHQPLTDANTALKLRATDERAAPHPAQAERAGLTPLERQIEQLRGLDTDNRVRFYEHDFYVLSNFSAFSIKWQGRRFPTSEHAYHWEKFEPGTRDDQGLYVRDCILYAYSAHDAFKLAERCKPLRRPEWDDVKVETMRGILRAKVDQHEYVRRKLLDTGDRELVEDSWRDDFWGWGPTRDGKNMLGRLWMEVRAELRAAISQTEAAATTGGAT